MSIPVSGADGFTTVHLSDAELALGNPSAVVPDTDGDGAVDSVDRCPTVHGTSVEVCASSGALARTTALFAAGELRVNDRSSVRSADGTLQAVRNAGHGDTNLGVESEVGSVVATGSVTLRDRSLVEGAVIAGGSVAVGSGVHVGSVAESSSVSLASFEALSFDFPTYEAGSVLLGPGESQAITPGAYSSVLLHADSHLELSGEGPFYFGSLTLGPDALVTVDDRFGPATLMVESSLVLDGYLETRSGSHNTLFIGYLGSSQASIHRSFSGTLVAPHAKINLASTPLGHFGAFFGQSIELHQDTVVWFHPFVAEWPAFQHSEPAPPSPECAVASAVDLGAPGHNVTVSAGGCVRVQDGYPSWWGTRVMQLQSTAGTSAPIAFTWNNACSGSGGSGVINGDWQSLSLASTSHACATLIDLKGADAGSVTLRYY